jgi:hypothetical protein
MSDELTFINGELDEEYHAFSIGRSCRLNLHTAKIVGLQELNCTVYNNDERPDKVNFCWTSANGKHHTHELEKNPEGHWTVVNPFSCIGGEPKWLTSVNPDESDNPL